MSLLIKNISDINITNKMDPKISIPVEQQNNIYEITTFWAYLKDSNFLSNPKARYTVKSFGELIENRSKNSFVVSYFSFFQPSLKAVLCTESLSETIIVSWKILSGINTKLQSDLFIENDLSDLFRKRPNYSGNLAK